MGVWEVKLEEEEDELKYWGGGLEWNYWRGRRERRKHLRMAILGWCVWMMRIEKKRKTLGFRLEGERERY